MPRMISPQNNLHANHRLAAARHLGRSSNAIPTPLSQGSPDHTRSRACRILPARLLLMLVALVIVCGISASSTAVQADQVPDKLFVEVRRSLLLELGEKVETVSITDTELADFVIAAKTQVLIHGKKEGITSLVVWTVGGTYKRYDLVIRRGYATKQILLNVRVAELTSNALTEYGIDYVARQFGLDSDRAIGIYSGGVSKPAIPLSAGSLPEFSDEASVAMRWIKGTEDYEALIHALERDGMLKILARPNLVCLDGEKASFLAGGEIPIPVAQTSSVGGTTITVEWREFGTQLDFLPTIIDSTLINLKVAPEVSSLDYNNAVAIGGFVVPALQTRRVATHVELHDGESLVIGGLRSTNERRIEHKIPLLGDIPLLGHLFRNVSHQTEENELLVIVSPTIIDPTTTVVPPDPWEKEQTEPGD